MNSHNKTNYGFTLVEVIVTLVILAILAAISIPALTGFIQESNNKTAVMDARTFYTIAQTDLTAWYGNPSRAKSGAEPKREIESVILPHVKADLEITSAGNNKGWTGSNSFEIAGGNMIQSGSYSWTNFVNSRGKNRAIIWVNTNPAKVRGIYYISQDGKTAVRIVYVKSNDFATDVTTVAHTP